MKLRIVGVLGILTLLLAAVVVVPAQSMPVAQTVSAPVPEDHPNLESPQQTYEYWAVPGRMEQAIANSYPFTGLEGQPGSGVDPALAVPPGDAMEMPGARPGETPQPARAVAASGIQPVNLTTLWLPHEWPYAYSYMVGAWSQFFPERTNAKVFYTQSGTPYVGSAVVVTDAGAGVNRLVMTAGQVVRSSSGVWSSAVLVCPAYSNGNGPWGCWGWSNMWNYANWGGSGDWRFDYGFIVTTTTSSGGYGRIGTTIGVNGLACNYGYEQEEWSFGYPSLAPYDGKYLIFNTSSTGGIDNVVLSGTPYAQGIGSTMTHDGAYGGAWAYGQRLAVSGYVNGVNAWWYASHPQEWFSPYFDCTNWYNLWNSARLNNP